MNRNQSRCIITLPFMFLSCICLAGDGTVHGFGRYPQLVDQPSQGYQQLYEWNLFLSPLSGTTIGPSRRLGAPPGEPARHDGYYTISASAGIYSIYVNQPLFYARPKVIPKATIKSGGTTLQHISPAVDFCCNTTDTWALPWQSTWCQTFTARGTSITGVSFRLAGTSAEKIKVTIAAEKSGTSVPQWAPVSQNASRTIKVGSLGDNWVKWLSGTVPTQPGNTYAVILEGASGGDLKFSPFNRDKDGFSYEEGRAYNATGEAQNYDLNVTVFSDSDGTVISYCKRTLGLGELRDGFYGGRWGQTFTAKGNSLAAVDVWAAGADHHWDLDFTFTVRKGNPTGEKIGPTKTTKAAYQAFGAGLHAVSYNPGEVTLEPGEVYYVEFTNSEGFNPYVMDDSADAYSSGKAWQDGTPAANGTADLSMTILEYAEEGGAIEGDVKSDNGTAVPQAKIWLDPGPYAATTDSEGRFNISGITADTYSVHCEADGFSSAVLSGVTVTAEETAQVSIALEPLACETPFENGSFENGTSAWTWYGGAKEQVIDGSWFADITAFDGAHFQGNEVNGLPLDPGGMYQSFCTVPGHKYRAEVYSSVYWIGGDARCARNRIGLDPSGGTSAQAGRVNWSSWQTESQEATTAWEKISVEAEANSTLMTVFLDFLQTHVSGSQWHINCFDAATIEDLTPSSPFFRRGDCNNDSACNLSDPICILGYLFAGHQVTCLDALDTQDDGKIDLSDAVFLLAYLFAGGNAPASPGLTCGPDPTPEDAFDCRESDC